VRRKKSVTSNEKCCIALQHCCMAPESGLPSYWEHGLKS
jgi:hypothetical protein